MKRLLAVLLSSFCGVALAGEVAPSVEPVTVEQYDYAQHLDIAHVISISDVADVCAVVPVRMTYEDSSGQQHILEYRVMGNGCSNG